MSQAPAHRFEWWDHIFILHALKVGLAGVLALFFAEALRVQFPQWSLFTVMVLMIVQYPGSIALKSLFRFVGTLIGASLGVWVVSDYASAPIPFLSLTFLVMSFASYKAGQLRRSMAPYGYLLAGLTLITIESSGLTQPNTAWSVALSRTEEIFVGIITVLIRLFCLENARDDLLDVRYAFTRFGFSRTQRAKTGSIRIHYEQLLRGHDRLNTRSDRSASDLNPRHSTIDSRRSGLADFLRIRPLHPVFRPQDLPLKFWLQVLTCCWWGLAAHELIALLALPTAMRGTAIENKLLSDIIAASIYVCSALAMMGFVFGLSLQGLLATSGIIAIVLGLALQSTLGDVFSGLSLSIEKPYRIGDEILLEGGAGGEVIQMNWRSTHLKNGANDVVIVPNSALAKMRIQNHSAGSRSYGESLTVSVDSRNEPEFTLEILKQAAMTCPSILEHPAPSAVATEFRGDRITYDISFSTPSIASAGEARSQLIAQLYKRARPIIGQRESSGDMAAPDSLYSYPIFLFAENEVLDHLNSSSRRSIEPRFSRLRSSSVIFYGASGVSFIWKSHHES